MLSNLAFLWSISTKRITMSESLLENMTTREVDTSDLIMISIWSANISSRSFESEYVDLRTDNEINSIKPVCIFCVLYCICDRRETVRLARYPRANNKALCVRYWRKWQINAKWGIRPLDVDHGLLTFHVSRCSGKMECVAGMLQRGSGSENWRQSGFKIVPTQIMYAWHWPEQIWWTKFLVTAT